MSYTTRTPTGIRNVHTRVTPGPMSRATQLFESVATPTDELWPADRWPAIELDRGLRPGSRGGHGPIRYRVEAAEPGRSVTFRFTGEESLVGTHALRIDPVDGDRVRWTHVLDVEHPSPVLTKVILPLHDALLEDLLDQAEAKQSGTTLRRRPFSPRVRACLAAERALERAPEPEPELARRRPLAWGTAGVLGAIAALHVAWGLGSAWPLRDRQALARTVVGSASNERTGHVPGPLACHAVAAALAAAAGLTVSRVAPAGHRAVPDGVSHAGVRTASAVLALRGAFGLLQSGFRPRSVTPEYRRLDLTLYSPLCLALAAALHRTAR